VPSGAGVLAEAESSVLALMAPMSFAQSSSARVAALAAFTSAKVISFSCLFALSLILRAATAHVFSSIVFDLRSFWPCVPPESKSWWESKLWNKAGKVLEVLG
jgi:hypothetical protein